MSKKSRQKADITAAPPEVPADEAETPTEVEAESAPATSEAALPAPVAPSEEAKTDEAPKGDVTIGNLTGATLQLPLASGHIRLGPKASEVVPASEVNEDTRLAARDGRIVLHPHT